MPLDPGTLLGPYEIEQMIGAGGMGEVYRATDTRLKRVVAIKVLPAAVATDSDRLTRFQREAEALAALNHPHIAQIYGLEKSDGITALVLELVEGPTVAELIGQGPVTVEEARRIGAQIAGALEAAHDRGIIHRDLKPANIKLTALREVKVLDFGLAKASSCTDYDADLTATSPGAGTRPGVIMGTTAYMSPEQAAGIPLDRRSDIWAFGCVLYELLTGRRAFPGDSIAAVTGAILAGNVDWSRIPSSTPPVIVALLHRCFERDPRRRLRDIGEARVVLEDSAAAWRVELPASRARAHVRRVWTLGAGLAAAAAIALAIVSQRASWTAQAPPQGMMQFTIPLAPADRLPATASFSRPSDRAVAISRDGQVVVFAGERVSGTGSAAILYRRPIDQPVATPIAGTDGARVGFLSPDGASVGFVAPGGTLRSVQVAGGSPVEVCALDLDGSGGEIVGASWGDDGHIVLGSLSGPLRRVAATGGTPTDITSFAAEASDYSHRLPHHLPDARGVIYTAIADPVADSGRIYVLPRSGKPKLILEDAADARYARSGHLLFVRRGVLMAVPFDLEKLEVSGAPQPIAHDVMQSLGSDNPWWNSAAGQFDLSEKGTLVYATGGVYPPIINRLLWLYRDGRTELIGETGRSLLGPRLSPDGKEIVVGQMRDHKQPLRVYDLRRQLWTSWGTVAGQAAFPVWTLDGQQILFNWFTQGRGGIHILRGDGSAAPRALTSGPRSRVPSDVSPDGVLAFVEAFTPTRMDIWVMPLDGSAAPRPVVRNPGDDVQPAFAPDGRWLAYSSDVSGILELYVEAFPGPGRRVQVSSGGGVGAVWARDARTLYFVGFIDNEPTLMEAAIQTNPSLSAGKPQVVTRFPYLVSRPVRSHDVAPDGQRFVVTTYDQPSGDPVTQLHVILNWPNALKN